jgi:hypothetical protein
MFLKVALSIHMIGFLPKVLMICALILLKMFIFF